MTTTIENQDLGSPTFNVFAVVIWKSYEVCSVLAKDETEALELAARSRVLWKPCGGETGLPERVDFKINDAERIS